MEHNVKTLTLYLLWFLGDAWITIDPGDNTGPHIPSTYKGKCHFHRVIWGIKQNPRRMGGNVQDITIPILGGMPHYITWKIVTETLCLAVHPHHVGKMAEILTGPIKTFIACSRPCTGYGCACTIVSHTDLVRNSPGLYVLQLPMTNSSTFDHRVVAWQVIKST